jgi:predicted nuclease with TOPRIM domain
MPQEDCKTAKMLNGEPEALRWDSCLRSVLNYLVMASRKRPTANNHLQEAMARLIANQAAFDEQISRNEQERLALERRSDERFARLEEWQRKSDERFARIEAELRELPGKIIQAVLDELPRIKKEIGFKTPR